MATMTLRERVIKAGRMGSLQSDSPYADYFAVARAALEEAKKYRMQHHDDCPARDAGGWLIEHYRDHKGDPIQPEWWDGLSFRTNADHAIRFSREMDAKHMLSLLAGNTFAFDCRVTEHLWMTDKPCSCGLDNLLRLIRRN